MQRHHIVFDLMAIVGLAIVIGVPFVGTNVENVQTDGGYVGYITQRPIFASARFIGCQIGPSSSGLAWRYDVRNVSVTPFSYDEDFPLNKGPLSADGMPVQFHLGVVWKIRAAGVRGFVEKFATPKVGDKIGDLERRAYDDFLKDRGRGYALAEISAREYTRISNATVEIEKQVKARLDAYVAESTAPFDIISVNITNVAFPPEVAGAVAMRIAAKQDLERQETELQIIGKKAEQRVKEAEGIKRAQEIISTTLSKEHLIYLAIEAQKLQVNSSNHTVVYIPTGEMGIPMMPTFEAARPAPTQSRMPSPQAAPAAK